MNAQALGKASNLKDSDSRYGEYMNELIWPTGANRVGIAWESIVLAAICAIDMVSTLWLIANGYARESNPILDYYLSHGGAVAFAGAKMLLFLGPLSLLELIRRQRPEFVRSMLRVGITAYLALYIIGLY